MTNPTLDTGDVYQKIVDASLANLPDDWNTARITIYMLSSQSHLGAEYTTQNVEAPIKFVPTFDALRAFKELRELTAQPGKGAWYTAIFKMDRSGKFDVEFDYDIKPAFPYDVDDEDYHEDLDEYPREPEYIPEWMPAR
ncbi:immunity protein YezG family protein [Actinosynnema sp. NPDC023658]|uniref:immunity protein YezG family protein n=1 Tax=Actinosynnema sp. NPDC023658 TaxID=3155465 RepID=UPI0033E01FB6